MPRGHVGSLTPRLRCCGAVFSFRMQSVVLCRTWVRKLADRCSNSVFQHQNACECAMMRNTAFSARFSSQAGRQHGVYLKNLTRFQTRPYGHSQLQVSYSAPYVACAGSQPARFNTRHLPPKGRSCLCESTLESERRSRAGNQDNFGGCEPPQAAACVGFLRLCCLGGYCNVEPQLGLFS